AIIPGTHVLRSLPDNALALSAGQCWLNRGGDARGDVVLHGEDIGQIAVITVGPEMSAGRCIDQLAGDAHALANLAHAAFENIADPKIAADLLNLSGFAFVGEC